MENVFKTSFFYFAEQQTIARLTKCLFCFKVFLLSLRLFFRSSSSALLLRFDSLFDSIRQVKCSRDASTDASSSLVNNLGPCVVMCCAISSQPINHHHASSWSRSRDHSREFNRGLHFISESHIIDDAIHSKPLLGCSWKRIIDFDIKSCLPYCCSWSATETLNSDWEHRKMLIVWSSEALSRSHP